MIAVAMPRYVRPENPYGESARWGPGLALRMHQKQTSLDPVRNCHPWVHVRQTPQSSHVRCSAVVSRLRGQAMPPVYPVPSPLSTRLVFRGRVWYNGQAAEEDRDSITGAG
jgi:hypothetical protein